MTATARVQKIRGWLDQREPEEAERLTKEGRKKGLLAGNEAVRVRLSVHDPTRGPRRAKRENEPSRKDLPPLGSVD